MKRLLFLLLCFGSLMAFSQSKKTTSYIQQLDNTQFIIKHNAPASFDIKSKAMNKLVKTGKPAVEQLIMSLNDTSKTIMSHIVLCHIFFKHVSFAGPKYVSNEKQSIAKYYLGPEKGEGLIITEIKSKNGIYEKYITPEDRDKIIAYWKNKNSEKIK